MTNFGLALYNWRMENGMPQEKAARRLGVSGATLGLWEKGKTEPLKHNFQRVAEIIGYDPESTAEPVTAEPEESTLDLANLPGANARERMLERDRRLAYMERNREMVAERDAEPEDEPVELPLDKPMMPDGVKMARLLGFLEGLAAVPDYDLTLMLETPISIVREMMEEHYGC